MAPGRSQIHPPSDLGAHSQLETAPPTSSWNSPRPHPHTSRPSRPRLQPSRLPRRHPHHANLVTSNAQDWLDPPLPRPPPSHRRSPQYAATSKTATTSQLNSSRHPAPRPRSRWTEHPGQSRSEVAFCARRKHGEVAARRHYPRAPYHHARTPRGREGPRSPGPSGGGIGCRRIRQQCAAVRLRGPCRGADATCPQTTAAPTPLSSASPAASPREKPPAVLHPLSGTARLTRCPGRTRRSSRPS